MKGSFLFLGTGASSGIPMIGCDCAVCASTNPKNQRLRPAGLIRVGQKTLLIDVGPDFRQQMLRMGVDHIDGLLLTHTHYDHIAGLDDLRILQFRQKKPFPCLLSKESWEDLQRRYYYMFRERGEGESFALSLDSKILPSDTGEIEFMGMKVGYVSYGQGGMKVNGYRMGNFAYMSDIRDYQEDVFPFLKGVDQLVLSALAPEKNRVHLSFDEAVAFAKKAGVRQTWLTHMSHKVEHESASKSLPPSVQPAYDGLEIEWK
jgi:phosphoribosyl 1,2-cyclic phosphate phosphodiesterase